MGRERKRGEGRDSLDLPAVTTAALGTSGRP